LFFLHGKDKNAGFRLKASRTFGGWVAGDPLRELTGNVPQCYWRVNATELFATPFF